MRGADDDEETTIAEQILMDSYEPKCYNRVVYEQYQIKIQRDKSDFDDDE